MVSEEQTNNADFTVQNIQTIRLQNTSASNAPGTASSNIENPQNSSQVLTGQVSSYETANSTDDANKVTANRAKTKFPDIDITSEFSSMEAADYAIRFGSQKNSNVKTYRTGTLKKLFCSIISKDSSRKYKKWFRDAKMARRNEIDDEKEQRNRRCNFYAVVQQNTEESVKLIYEKERLINTSVWKSNKKNVQREKMPL